MFAVIQVPDFALQCALRHEPELRDCALAIVDGNLPARIRQMTPAACAHGVAEGMTTTQALGRCPRLLFRTPGALEAERACLLQIAESASPWIEATDEGVVTIEWRRAESGRWSVAGEALFAQFGALDFAAQIGIAATPDLALLAAHCARPVLEVKSAAAFLAELPLEVLAADPDSQAATSAAVELRAERAASFRLLRRWGITTLGAFAALRREDVVARLGPAAAGLWDRACGRAARPLRLVRAPEIFAESMELEHEVETLEPLLFLLRRFVEQLAARLAAAYRVAASLTLTLHFAEGAPHVRELHIPAPTCEVDVLFRVLSTHLEGVTAAAPIVALVLGAQATRAEQKQFGLFEGGLRDPNKFFETLARLHALLGSDRAGTPVAENSHRPEAFHLATPRFGESPVDAVPEAVSGLPLQRFRPPLEAKVQAIDGRPRHVFSDHAFGEVTACRGPWIGSGEWWGERAWERIEWDVTVGKQSYRLAQQGAEWFVEGAYD